MDYGRILKEYYQGKPKEECGVIGIFKNDSGLSKYLYYGLYTLQHRVRRVRVLPSVTGSVPTIIRPWVLCPRCLVRKSSPE